MDGAAVPGQDVRLEVLLLEAAPQRRGSPPWWAPTHPGTPAHPFGSVAELALARSPRPWDGLPLSICGATPWPSRPLGCWGAEWVSAGHPAGGCTLGGSEALATLVWSGTEGRGRGRHGTVRAPRACRCAPPWGEAAPSPARRPRHSEASAWLFSKSELVSALGQEGQERDVSRGGCAFLGVSQEEAGEGKTGLCPGPLLAGAPTRLHRPALWALWVLALALSLSFPWEWGRQQLLPAVGRMEAQTHMCSGPSNTVLTAGLAHARRPPSPEPA